MNRALDVAIAGAGLVVTSPFLAAGALAVKLEDGGPVLYRQTRVGRDGVDFELLKLRTMIVGAEKQGAGFAVDKGDARITRVGRLLRRFGNLNNRGAIKGQPEMNPGAGIPGI